MDWLKRQFAALVQLFQVDIWSAESLRENNPRGRLHAFLRVLSITFSGLGENRAVSRAAALSFSSLIGLGPLVALTMMIAGFMLNDEDPDLAVDYLNRLIRFVAPQIDQYELAAAAEAVEIQQETGGTIVVPAPTNDDGASSDDADAPQAIEVRPELVEFINGFVSSSRNGAVGAVGALTLILIVLQLFTSIETAFNDIWGVRRGRAWIMRIAFYWMVISLGAVLFFAALTGLAGGAFTNAFAAKLPYGSQLVAMMQFFLPLISFITLVVVLTIFYRAIPNTHVNWFAALVGAFIVGVLLIANNYLAFLYISRVLLSRALYGSLAIPIVLMFGLYVFWFFVLLGGQVSYAVQNARFRNSLAAWNTLAESTRERLSLMVLLTVCRRFHNCQEPPTAPELGESMGVPDQLLNECLNRLVRTELLTPIPSPDGQATVDDRYMPARPLGRTTLAHFKRRDDDHGDDPAGPDLAHHEPLLACYHQATTELTQTELFQTPLDQLFEQHPLPPTSTESARALR
ncbi:YihY/virulence factor BrkB family protein [Actomonas aquatica]|uniref:YihY/virulence factor BrkB family protein n=1 Tax=Actomonas aquatica TaxID=2866162 RepID=A0ABZ1CEU6_9BACT|nr:YihY/virulence factor BrkB family protein [Opitutus sp. WL0086]WRQ89124.1 YihY/virulence factor BrkB family protein [Opitutus sp. WL0086]